VVAVGGGQLGQLLAGGVEGLLLGPAQTDAAQLHVAQLGRQDAPLGGVKTALAGELLQGAVDHLRLAGPVAKGDHRTLLALVGLAQLGGVADPVEVADDPPAPAQPFAQMVQRVHQLGPVQRLGLG